jgi:branched-chain amino acid transport system permease protein
VHGKEQADGGGANVPVSTIASGQARPEEGAGFAYFTVGEITGRVGVKDMIPAVPGDSHTVAHPARSTAWAGVALGLVACVVILSILSRVFGTFGQQILSQAFFYAIIVVTVDLLWGYTGILTFGQSAFFGIGAYGIAIARAYHSSDAATTILAMIGAMVLAAVVALSVSWLSFTDRASPIYVSVVTLALPVVFTQVILSGGAFTGSSSGLPFPVPPISIPQWYWISASSLLLVAMTAYVFTASDFGRLLLAIRDDEERCRYLGLDTSRIKTRLMIVCGAISALAGAGYALFANVAAPAYGDFVFGTQLVVWTALGGRGTLIGPILGAVFINYVSAVLGGNLPFVWLLLIGLIFVVVVVYLPSGLGPSLFLAVTHALSGLGRIRGREGLTGRIAEGHRSVVVMGSDSEGEPSISCASQVALELRGIVKNYGSLRVLDGVSFQAHYGEIIGIVGPNGAGKTTLLRCISDGRERSAGEVIINGSKIGRRPPQYLVALGLGLKFQTPRVFEALTVGDCLRVARSYRSRPSVWRRTRVLRLPGAIRQTLEATGLASAMHEPAGKLPHGMKQVLELAMVLALEPSVLLLDEPTAGLTAHERAAIGTILAGLAESHGLCILLIEHDLDFVRSISSRIVVLHQGRIIADGPVSEVVQSEAVREVYVGRGNSV